MNYLMAIQATDNSRLERLYKARIHYKETDVEILNYRAQGHLMRAAQELVKPLATKTHIAIYDDPDFVAHLLIPQIRTWLTLKYNLVWKPLAVWAYTEEDYDKTIQAVYDELVEECPPYLKIKRRQMHLQWEHIDESVSIRQRHRQLVEWKQRVDTHIEAAVEHLLDTTTIWLNGNDIDRLLSKKKETAIKETEQEEECLFSKLFIM